MRLVNELGLGAEIVGGIRIRVCVNKENVQATVGNVYGADNVQLTGNGCKADADEHAGAEQECGDCNFSLFHSDFSFMCFSIKLRFHFLMLKINISRTCVICQLTEKSEIFVKINKVSWKIKCFQEILCFCAPRPRAMSLRLAKRQIYIALLIFVYLFFS